MTMDEARWQPMQYFSWDIHTYGLRDYCGFVPIINYLICCYLLSFKGHL